VDDQRDAQWSIDRLLPRHSLVTSRKRTSPAGQAIPPHPGAASTASLTSLSNPCTLMTTSGSGAVGGRIGTIPSPRMANEARDELRERAGDVGCETGISLLNVYVLCKECIVQVFFIEWEDSSTRGSIDHLV
jgi:hypothetical protein